MPDIPRNDAQPAPHIIVAEDEPLAAMALEDFLSLNGYRVTLACDGVEAMERQQRDPADVLITDLRMPRMDGRTLIREIRALDAGLPVVVMTGFLALDPGQDELLDRRWQPLEVLRKPVSPQAILEALNRAIAGSAART
ncbi:CheY-like chemotaxis protein [Azospirillum fermentarium]|uniref:response regulator n=1 Tax=Azospirillum fermentarium TaxID=1233114 RepID=UPI0022263E3F|nr:response regulator [Azospirillum fermentarium]MCW2247577.1 CheY-like chemotaxis protein [Azospirillum fermentarium]